MSERSALTGADGTASVTAHAAPSQQFSVR